MEIWKMKNVLGVLDSKKCPVSNTLSIFNLSTFSPSDFRSLHQALQRTTPLFTVNERDVCEERGKFQVCTLLLTIFSFHHCGTCNKIVMYFHAEFCCQKHVTSDIHTTIILLQVVLLLLKLWRFWINERTNQFFCL